MVVVGHIFWLSDFGRFAVFGFYILSGYLMTYIMHTSYGYSSLGRKKFATNRFLRLYPAFWAAILCSIVITLFWGSSSNGFILPTNLAAIIGNTTMIFPHWMPSQIEPRLSPATWALTVELFFYVAIALGISKTLKRTYIWISLSVVFIVLSYVMNLYWHARYFSIPAGSLPFSLGALIFFLSKQKSVRYIPEAILASPIKLFFTSFCIAIVTSIAISQSLSFWLMEIIFYFCMAINFLLVLSLAKQNTFVNGLSTKLDKKIGDFSYPFYLLHYQAAAIASVISLGKVASLKENFSLISCMLTFLILFIMSLCVIKLIDKPVEKLRQTIKAK
ncbi:Peptidoglycan/LPS O-acetylase OafA/YrhL, contains acyltransferase and SGNH-hydrolase domains [Colwellia chukchiensis]|uniref:Peptidoglycan/LPS O-acetylase OafA/YrhL, contains acyltransferase and SGNH-hydrolase domains n=2 Tax=Colwellia chukchiensis TaxID=641665 RepID=A0A1H7SEB2_9GAMM|nr:Peptidoglycan/LPS O-acetylase OafA/YrhL, contains acyltransferase and SGNH-hydrolase domains [Colwellia chukchiensis]